MKIIGKCSRLLAPLLVVACIPQDESELATASFDPRTASIADIRMMLTSGEATCVEIVSAYIDRIAYFDDDTGLNAVSVVNPDALKKATAIDRALANGEPAGPLVCAPILVKDNFDTHDLPTTGGSLALKDNYPPDDAFVIQSLRNAGAIVVAKTNMGEWAFSPRESVSSTHGATANAYDLSKTPAGSSGGSASGVAAGFGVAALGTDTGNSVRGPSSHLSIFGIRSTIGLVSRDGVIPLNLDRDVVGPMTKTVEDSARILSVIAGYDANDPVTDAPEAYKGIQYTDFLDEDGLKGARIGVVRELAAEAAMDPEVYRLFQQALADLGAAGAEIVDPVEIPNLRQHYENGYYCPTFRADMRDYMMSLGEAAPFLDIRTVYEDGIYAANSKDAFEYFQSGADDRSYEEECPYLMEHEGRRAFRQDVMLTMNTLKLDALVYPSWTHPPADLATAQEDYRGDNSQLIAPTVNMPAASVPMGYTSEGLPAGLQIMARPYDEASVFKFAYAYEQRTAHRRPPALFPSLKRQN